MSALQIAKSIANFFAVGHNFNERETERERGRESEGERGIVFTLNWVNSPLCYLWLILPPAIAK